MGWRTNGQWLTSTVRVSGASAERRRSDSATLSADHAARLTYGMGVQEHLVGADYARRVGVSQGFCCGRRARGEPRVVVEWEQWCDSDRFTVALPHQELVLGRANTVLPAHRHEGLVPVPAAELHRIGEGSTARGCQVPR